MKGYKKVFDRLIFTYFKEHKCPKCNEELSIIELSKVINYKSEEAKDYDLDGLIGDIRYAWDEFKCDNCGYQITISDLYRYEKGKRREERKNRKNNKGE